MNKNQNKSSSSSGGNLRGDVSFIRAVSKSVQQQHSSSVVSSSSGYPSNQELEFDNNAAMQHYNISPPSSSSSSHQHHLPQQSHSSQEISQHAFYPSSTQDIVSQQHHSSHSLHHYHHHHQQRSSSSKQQQHQHQQPIEQYHPTDLPDQNPYLISGGVSGVGVGVGGGEMPAHTGVESWGSKEEAIAVELEEAKIRVAQMEKTMRWWSDCTSNWREKWNKARNERNKAREENRILRVKLESVSKEYSRLKRERKELAAEDKDKKGEGGGGGKLSKSSSSPSSHHQHHKSSKEDLLSELSEKEKTVLARANEKECESTDELSEASSPKSGSGLVVGDNNEGTIEIRSGGVSVSSVSPSHPHPQPHDHHSDDGFELMEAKAASSRIAELEEELARCQAKAAHTLDNAVMMQRKLDEANNTIQAERLESCSQAKVIQNLKLEIEELQAALNDVAKAKSNLRKELDEMREKHRDEMNRLSVDLEDESSSRSSMDKHITELRRELERLQSENASEWGKRERLESEKLLLDRDNKKIRAQVKDLEEELERRTQASNSSASLDIKTMQFELVEKTKMEKLERRRTQATNSSASLDIKTMQFELVEKATELSELKHLNSKLKKALSDRSTELDHNKRRAEQYETEVRKLRGRIDELKHDLATAEDEVDTQTNAVRKSQRGNDELQEQVDSLQVQVTHLQSRLKRPGNAMSASTPRSASLKNFSLEDTADFADSENDFDDI